MAKPKSLQAASIFLFFLLLGGCSSEQVENGAVIEGYFGVSRTTGALDRFLKSKMLEMEIPGLAFAMINNGQVVHHKTLGYANLEQQLPVTDKTIFEGASISKSLFAFFVMTYVEEGRLDLDRPLHEYLPYPDISHDERYKKITARMVLSHRSGLPNWRRNEEDGQLRIKFEPGTDYLYSGEGYQYLAKVLMRIDNTDMYGLEAAFQHRIAEPIGLKHTVFIQTPYTRKHKAEAYDEGGQRIDLMSNNEFGSAYSIHTEPIDFSRWMIAVMNEEILSEDSYNELFMPHSSAPSAGDYDISYTLGFLKLHVPDADIYLHSGNNDGFTCMYLLDTKKDWGFSVFTNSEYGEDLGNALGEFLMARVE